MADNLNYAVDYQQAIQEAFFGGLYSADLWNSPSNSLIKWTGSQEIKLPRLTILQGMQDRTRQAITTPTANYSNSWDTYQLKNERYWSTLVDPVDVDETNYVASMANITNQFNRWEKIPEHDRYMFSKLYKEKVAIDGTNGIQTTALTANNILGVFDTIMTQMDEARVPAAGRLLYVTPTTNTLLKNADGIIRQMDVSGSSNNKISRSVHSLDDVDIRIVPSDLMHTDFDFTSGAQIKAGASQIDMFLISNGCQVAPEKYSFAGFDAPSALTAGNWLYYEQLYNDVLLLKTKSAGIQFVLDPVAVTIPSASTPTSASTSASTPSK